MIDWRPIKGVDYEKSDLSLGPELCSDARNFLFERGMARTRPYARVEESIYNQGSKIDFAKTFLLEGKNRYTIYLQNGALRRLGCSECDTSYSAGEITGAGTSLGDREFQNAIAVNGNIVVGNNITGALHHTPLSTSTYTVLSDSKYRFFTSSFSRAFAAYDITSGSNDPRKVAWSAAGDETDWTGTGSGTSTLSDITDGITGLANIFNVVAILRQTGISLGYVTGSNTTGPFRFELVVRDGVGCMWPSTLDQYNNVLYFVGPEDVYIYQLGQAPRAIGGAVRDRLLDQLSQGGRFQGVVTKGDFLYDKGLETVDGVGNRFRPRVRYHLIPIASPGDHYCYDVRDNTWSVHSYSFNIREAYQSIRKVDNHPVWNLSFIDDSANPSNIMWWDGASGVRSAKAAIPTGWPDERIDQDAFLTSPVFSSGGVDVDLDGVIVHWALDATADDYPKAEIEVRWKNRYLNRSGSVTRPFGDLDPSQKWTRTEFNIRANGSEFQFVLRIPAGLKVKIDRVVGNIKGSVKMRNSAYV